MRPHCIALSECALSGNTIEHFQIIGHRGASALEPENTLRSFARAVDEGVDGIEFDIHLIDGRLLVLHDETLDRTSNGSGSAYTQSYEALRKLDFGAGQQIPRLEEAIASIPEKLLVNIELKGKRTASATAVTLRNHPRRRFMVSSFRFAELKEFAKGMTTSSHVDLAYLRLELGESTIREARQIGATAINLADWAVNADVIAKTDRAGLRVYVYTVNDLSRAKALKRMGAAGIFTDAPHLIKQELLQLQ